MPSSPETLKQIEDIVKGSKVVLFMKGNKNFPQCGFSSTVVQILGDIVGDFETVNVLEDQGIRQGVKDYAEWPTIPQLYIDGEFVGGCDIIKQMNVNGDLHKQLGVEQDPVSAPSICCSEAAATELKAALADSDPGDAVHIQVDLSFRHDMSVGPVEADLFQVTAAGVPFCFDRASARRADGLSIDFVTEDGEAGFKLDNPHRSTK
ncbi:MAG: Grx4 family monothiol glutaredoxin [Myxococcales bacterium]|nr:Grx4 family monothiol glutaredoxin [Myxococcales bacterium]